MTNLKWGLCLDLDGTILDSFNEGQKRMFRAARTIGLPVTPEMEERVKPIWGKSISQMVSDLWPLADIEMLRSEWKKIEMSELISPFPGVVEVLGKLKEKFYVSILTSRDRESTEYQIQPFRHLFDFVVTLDDVMFAKPHPRSMEPALVRFKKLEVSAGHITICGDTVEPDLKLAQNMRMQFYGVTTGVSKREDFINAGLQEKFIINSVADLATVFDVENSISLR